MPQVLTDADIEKLSGPKPLSDADIAAAESKPAKLSLPSPQDTAHKDFLDFKAAHPNIKESDIQELNTTPDPQLHDINAFKENHPYVYGALHMLFNDATPAPGIMAVEGPLGAAVQSATKAGGQTAGQFVDAVLSHPKTIAAMKDAATEWLYSLPMVKALAKTAKGVGAVKEVIDDVRAAQAVKEVPMAPGPTPVRPPLAPKPVMTVPAETATPVRPPLAPLPESTDIGIHGGMENTPIPRPADPGLTGKLNDLLRKLKIEAGDNPDLPTGEVKGGRYLAKFDEGGNAPVIQSQLRKPYSTAEPANPSLIAKDIGQKLAGRITVEQFDSMSKNPKALAVITRQYGIEPDDALISMIRRRIKAKTGDVPSNSVISIADLMRTK